MLNLLQRQKWFEERKSFHVNDVVSLVEDIQQRSKWVMSRIRKTYPDKRGLVKTALIKILTNVVYKLNTELCPVIIHESSLPTTVLYNVMRINIFRCGSILLLLHLLFIDKLVLAIFSCLLNEYCDSQEGVLRRL